MGCQLLLSGADLLVCWDSWHCLAQVIVPSASALAAIGWALTVNGNSWISYASTQSYYGTVPRHFCNPCRSQKSIVVISARTWAESVQFKKSGQGIEKCKCMCLQCFWRIFKLSWDFFWQTLMFQQPVDKPAVGSYRQLKCHSLGLRGTPGVWPLLAPCITPFV